MKKAFILSFVVAGVFSLFSLLLPVHCMSEDLPELSLLTPDGQADRDYLGLQGEANDPFTLSDISADIIVIELFSMYCPYCQEEAPLVNEFHSLANRENDNGISIKMVGIGASNTDFEVKHFRDSFEVAFPLFSDKNLEMYDKLKGEGTPGFIVVAMKQGETPKIVLRQSGGFDSPESFLATLLEKSGYK